MSQFVSNDARQLIVIKQIEQTGCDCHRVCFLVYARSKGVEHIIVHNIYLRHIHTTRHAEILHNIIYTRILTSLKRTRISGIGYDGGIGKIGYRKPYSHAYDNPRQSAEEIHIHLIPGNLTYPFSCIIIVSSVKITDYSNENIHHTQQYARKKQEQQDTHPVVPVYLGLNTNVFHAFYPF